MHDEDHYDFDEPPERFQVWPPTQGLKASVAASEPTVAVPVSKLRRLEVIIDNPGFGDVRNWLAEVWPEEKR